MSTHNLSVYQSYDVLNAVEADLKDQPELLDYFQAKKFSVDYVMYTEIAIARFTEKGDYPLLLADDIKTALKEALKDKVLWFHLDMSLDPCQTKVKVNFSLDNPQSWAWGELENSRFGRFVFDCKKKKIKLKGSGGLREEWQETSFKSADDAVQKFMAYIDRISAPSPFHRKNA